MGEKTYTVYQKGYEGAPIDQKDGKEEKYVTVC